MGRCFTNLAENRRNHRLHNLYVLFSAQRLDLGSVLVKHVYPHMLWGVYPLYGLYTYRPYGGIPPEWGYTPSPQYPQYLQSPYMGGLSHVGSRPILGTRRLGTFWGFVPASASPITGPRFRPPCRTSVQSLLGLPIYGKPSQYMGSLDIYLKSSHT